MILLCGIPSEAPLQLVAESARSRDVAVALLNQRDAQRMQFVVRYDAQGGTGFLELDGRRHDLDSFTGVYTRLMDVHDLPEMRPLGRRPLNAEQHRTVLLHEALQQWLEVAPCLVMNRNAPSASNMSKPYQAQLIRAAGFRIPQTLVTNDPAEARAFKTRHDRVVYKSISSIRSIVRELDRAGEKRLDSIRTLATQFQEYVAGTNVRVHVAGDAVFATRISTEAVDYRYARRDGLDVDMEPTSLPNDVEVRCRALADTLALPLCGIDLKLTPEGEYVCFEVNPSPAYSYYQEHTGQDIAGAIVCALLHGAGVCGEARP